MQGSNPRHLLCKNSALPTELIARKSNRHATLFGGFDCLRFGGWLVRFRWGVNRTAVGHFFDHRAVGPIAYERHREERVNEEDRQHLANGTAGADVLFDELSQFPIREQRIGGNGYGMLNGVCVRHGSKAL